MPNHTPEPWELMDAHLQNETHGDEAPCIVAWDEKLERSVTVAIVSPDADEKYANALLIVEAPRLLRELEHARIALDFYDQWVAKLTNDKESYPYGQGVARSARAAIAAAKGELS